MTSTAIEAKLEPGSTEQYGKLPEVDDPLTLQCAAIFDSCIAQVRAGDGVSIEEYGLAVTAVDRAQTGRELGEIITNTPSNEASLITINSLEEIGNLKKILFLRQGSGKRSLETFFEIGYEGSEAKSVHLMQKIQNGDGFKEKIINVDANGNIQDMHANENGRSRLHTNPKTCIRDIAVVAETVAEPVKQAIKHTTQEFDRVENPNITGNVPEEVPQSLFRAVMFGVQHRGEGLKLVA
ncbi:MAG: hypothetical protein Q7T74_03360 [Candidatus Saccharibacteria bacterium]|nr:hypothetical protein [Candidatus Saccharibacteria bacterium]